MLVPYMTIKDNDEVTLKYNPLNDIDTRLNAWTHHKLASLLTKDIEICARDIPNIDRSADNTTNLWESIMKNKTKKSGDNFRLFPKFEMDR